MKKKHPIHHAAHAAWSYCVKRKLASFLVSLLGAGALAVAGVVGCDLYGKMKVTVILHHENAIEFPILRGVVTNLQTQVQDMRAQLESQRADFVQYTNRQYWYWVRQERTNTMLLNLGK